MSKKEKKSIESAALVYHQQGRPGKIAVVPTKAHATQRDLSLAYSPGVAAPCLAIQEKPLNAYKYTAKGNLVAVISNGTAVLGLGNIGALASKPVMEGKALLFKIFADIDVFDIEINESDPEKFIQTVKALEPTFGGINLEDIKAPEAFEIERRLKTELSIPVMHDDQHGTAIISAAALINASEIAQKDIHKIHMVVNGAGSAAIACTNLYISLGVDPKNIIMCDSRGVITTNRKNLSAEKLPFAKSTSKKTLEEALVNADVFVGLSKGNVLTTDMLKSMSKNPIVFAMANPDPEIDYQLAIETRDDVIMATGRSDFPNQVNNVLGFPYIFRGALDVRATQINEAMKLAAVKAIADLAKEPVPDQVSLAYNEKSMAFGRNYIIPKPLDGRLITRVSPAVAHAAIQSGVAQELITDWASYEESLLDRMGYSDKLIRMMQNRARLNPKKLIFCNGDEPDVLKAANIVKEEGIAWVVLLGNQKKIQCLADELGIDLKDIQIIDPKKAENQEKVEQYAQLFFKKRSRKGITLYMARKQMITREFFGAMMLESADADALITGYSNSYKQSISPILQVIGKAKEIDKVSGLMMILTPKGPLFLADTVVIEEPSTQDLVNIAKMTASCVKSFGITPKIAFLSYENFTAQAPHSKKAAEAVAILHNQQPDLIVDGELQPDFALNDTLLRKEYPFSKLVNHRANVFIFPSLTSANIAYKLLRGLDSMPTVGPILLGMNKAVHVMAMGSSVEEIVHLATAAIIDAQQRSKD